MNEKQFLGKREIVLAELDKNIPSGVGKGADLKFSDVEMKEVLHEGMNWALKKNFATKEDLEHFWRRLEQGFAESEGAREKSAGDDWFWKSFCRGAES